MIREGIQAVIVTLLRLRRFLLHDIPSVLYDFEDNESIAYLSLPRLMFFISGLLICTAYIREHFFGIPFSSYPELVAFFSACSVGYVGKKFADNKERELEDQYHYLGTGSAKIDEEERDI